MRDAWSRFRALNGQDASPMVYDPRGTGTTATPVRRQNQTRVNLPNRQRVSVPVVPQGQTRQPRQSTYGPTRGRYSYGTNEVPTISLPIGLPSYDIVSVPGFTRTSNPRIDYRTIGAPLPGLGPGNLVPPSRNQTRGR